jgi:hypothetical protein
MEHVGLNKLPGVVAGFTTRAGGVSVPPYGSFNLAVSTGDRREDVLENRARLLAALDFPAGSLAIAGQVHGDHVEVAESAGLIRETDGLVTRRRGLLLGMVAADCAIVLVADAAGSCVGAAHAGWRGAVAGIVGNLVATLGGLQCDAADLHAYISPCISQARFEVGDEVAERFDERFVLFNGDSGKAHVDLRGALAAQLLAAGLEAQNVQIDGRCTYDDVENFYSYRAQNGQTGRMMGFVGLSRD